MTSDRKDLCKGAWATKNSSGHSVLWLHYSADPAKDPDTPEGKAWVADEKVRMMADLRPNAWRGEYELDFNAGSGDLVFPTFVRDRARLIIPTINLDESYVFYGGLDWGTKNLTAFTVTAEDAHGRFFTIYEQTWKMAAPVVVAQDIKQSPFYENLQWIACDPSMQTHVVWNAKGNTTIAEMLSSREHVGDYALDKLMAAHGRLDSVFINLIRNMWIQEPSRWMISENCPQLIGEITNLLHPEHDGVSNAKEKIQDKDNHLWDSQKYIFLSHPTAGKAIPKKPKYGTFGYLDEINKLAAAESEEFGTSESQSFQRLYGMSL